MNCDKVREWMSIYWDLPDNDLRRKSVDDHIATCPSCAEEFEAWRESREWISKQEARTARYLV